MSITGEENFNIGLTDASHLTARYRAQMTANQIKGGFFSKSYMLSLLNQDDCIGFRFYYGLNTDDKQVLILVAVDSNENDITGGDLMERSIPCPNTCGESNSLNSD